MADRGKRVEVRYGAFSCAIEGYADPVAQLREVLALMQRMIAEAPALAEQDAGLDDAGFARLDQALTELRARGDAADQGVIIIRSGQRIAGDAEDAEILASAGREAGEDSAQEEDGLPWREPETGPYSGAHYAAPAAAAAEAAFAAGMTADDAQTPADAPAEDFAEDFVETPAEQPLGHELPGETATAAALYPAPAADAAERAFRRDREDGSHAAGGADARPAGPADPDDDYGDRDPIWGDEAAVERVDGGDPADDPAGFEEPAQAEDEGPRAGWRLAEARDTARVRVNIFAPPPAGAARHWPAEERDADEVPDTPRRGGAALRHTEPRDAWRGTDGSAAPDEVGAREAVRGDERTDDQRDERADEWADDDAGGDWVDARDVKRGGRRATDNGDEAGDAVDRDAGDGDAVDQEAGDGDAADGGADSTENRLAALITRYQSGAGTARDAEHGEHGHAAALGISAAELAERAGATEVADLLTVSAAWLTLAGGRPRFSRREVMEVFEMLPGEHPRTLEARIKGFGKLVRSGTLMLVEDGAFAMPPRERERFRELIGQG